MWGQPAGHGGVLSSERGRLRPERPERSSHRAGFFASYMTTNRHSFIIMYFGIRVKSKANAGGAIDFPEDAIDNIAIPDDAAPIPLAAVAIPR